MQPLRRLSRSRRAAFLLVLGLGVLPWLKMRTGAVVLYETGNPSANTTEPGGALAGSGWQFEGNFGVFLGTPIAPQFFVTAKHVAGAGASIDFSGQTYPVSKRHDNPNADLTIFKVTGTFPSFAPLFTGNDEAGRQLVVIGRGTQRGSEVSIDMTPKGWNWGPSDHVKRWGQNSVTSIDSFGAPFGDLLYATFDQDGSPNEAHLSSGDSGGAVFIRDAGTWKLAGINYAVDDVHVDNGMGGYSSLVACLFDARGFYAKNGSTYTLLAGSSPVPTGFYATRISSNLGWIYSVIDPMGSVCGDGIPNLIKYAMGLDPMQPSTSGTSQPGKEPGYATITFNKQTTATDLSYSIERSTALAAWTTASIVEELVQTNGTVNTIKAKVALDDESQLFLRLRVTRP